MEERREEKEVGEKEEGKIVLFSRTEFLLLIRFNLFLFVFFSCVVWSPLSLADAILTTTSYFR